MRSPSNSKGATVLFEVGRALIVLSVGALVVIGTMVFLLKTIIGTFRKV